MGLTYYELFGVSQGATNEEIERSYRSASKAYHPDAQGPVANAALFREVTAARDTLIDPVERKRYDDALLNTRFPAPEHSQSGSSSRQHEKDEPDFRTNSQRTRTATSRKMQRSKSLLIVAALAYFLSRFIIQFGNRAHLTFISYGGHQLMSLSSIPVLIFLIVPKRQGRRFYALVRTWAMRPIGGHKSRRA